MKLKVALLAAAAGSLLAGCAANSSSLTGVHSTPVTRTVIMVWDGLRPDSVNAIDTPNLYALQKSGVNFSDNHSTYPTFTMMNGSSFATGSFPKTSGFYGNTFWTPPRGAGNTVPVGAMASGSPADYVDPVFTEDYQILSTLNGYYGGQLLLVKTLFATAQQAGLVTATVGKSGAAYLQDLDRGGYFLDENTVMPRSLALELKESGFPLPANTFKQYTGNNALKADPVANGKPTDRADYIKFSTTAYDPDGAIGIQARDSSDATQGAPEDAANRYLMSVFTNYILPRKKPMLSLIWFRTPDNVEHGYGPGSANATAGLRSQDARLGELLAGLQANGMESTTDIVVVSDHGHSSVSGPLSLYPLRTIIPSTTPPDGPRVNGSTSGLTGAKLGPVAPDGYSFSGDVRSADLLTYRGLNAYDGNGCSTSAMYGLNAAGVPTVAVKRDPTGKVCGGKPYQAISATLPNPVASFKVPPPGALPPNAIVVAGNGGSDYFYLPGHDPVTLAKLVRVLQQREEYGAIFVDSRYGSLPGTFSMAQVNLENVRRENDGQPDVVASFNWDDSVSVRGMRGIEFESVYGQRGMHGSFSTVDVHNTLIARGPSFRTGTTITLPTGNVDLAPTVAHILGLSMPQADGRILNEALAAPVRDAAPVVTTRTVTSSAATGLRFELPTDPTGATGDPALPQGVYSIEMAVKDLTVGEQSYRYFDYAKAVRH